MRQIEEQLFKKENILYVEQLQTGMNQYYWDVFNGTEESYLKFLKAMYKKNEGSKLFVDFYYNRLDAMAKINLEKMLVKKDQIILHRLLDAHNETDSIFYECDENWISFFLHLSFKEVLFQTFYFTDPSVTLWTNYKGKFIVFSKDTKSRNVILEASKEAGLALDENY